MGSGGSGGKLGIYLPPLDFWKKFKRGRNASHINIKN
jgi:hypothetical protein